MAAGRPDATTDAPKDISGQGGQTFTLPPVQADAAANLDVGSEAATLQAIIDSWE